MLLVGAAPATDLRSRHCARAHEVKLKVDQKGHAEIRAARQTESDTCPKVCAPAHSCACLTVAVLGGIRTLALGECTRTPMELCCRSARGRRGVPAALSPSSQHSQHSQQRQEERQRQQQYWTSGSGPMCMSLSRSSRACCCSVVTPWLTGVKAAPGDAADAAGAPTALRRAKLRRRCPPSSSCTRNTSPGNRMK